MHLFYGALGIVIEAGTDKIVKTAVKNILAGENLSKLQKITTRLATVGISSWVAANSTKIVRNSLEEGAAIAMSLLRTTEVETPVETPVETQVEEGAAIAMSLLRTTEVETPVETPVETQVEESSSDE